MRSHKKSHRAKLDEEACVWLVRLESGELGQTGEDEFFAWLTTSPAHQAAYIRAEQLLQSVELPMRAMPSRFTRAASEFPRAQSLPLRWFSFPRLAAVAAMSIMMVLVSTFALKHSVGSLYQAEFITAVGEQKEVELADNSRLIINTQSRVKVVYLASKRQLILHEGEVFLQVQRDVDRPFSVEAGSGRVTVLGTQFAVKKNESDLQVTVKEGKVEMLALAEPSTSPEQSPRAVLTANQQLTLENLRSEQAPIYVDAASSLAWRKKQLIYREQPLDEVLTDLNRYFDKRLVLNDKQLSSKRVVAVIQLTDREKTLAALERSLGLKIHEEDDDKIVLKGVSQ